MICQSNNEGCWGPLCFCSCKPTPYPRPPWRCFGSLDIHLCRAREEELMGVPQRQIWAKVDKEQERTRRWRRGRLKRWQGWSPSHFPTEVTGSMHCFGASPVTPGVREDISWKKCFLLSIARITWPPPPPSGQLGSLFWTSKTTLSVNFNSRALLQCLIWWWI